MNGNPSTDKVVSSGQRGTDAPTWSRWAFCVMGGGLFFAFVGNVLRAYENREFANIASVVHQLGMVVMLCSSVALLIAYQVPRLQRVRRSTQHDVGGRNRRRDFFGIQDLFAAVTLIAVASGVLFATPERLLVFCVGYFQIAMLAIFLVVIVYDRGSPRAFCFAAAVPAICQPWLLRIGGTATATYVVGAVNSLSDYRWAVALSWALTLLIGGLGVLVKLRLGPSTTPHDTAPRDD